MKRFLSVCVFCLLLSGTQALRAQVIYITPSGAGTKSGSSWANAAPGSQLQESINGAASGSQIWVKAGTYAPYATRSFINTGKDIRDNPIQLKNGIGLYGGFAGTESNLSQRNIAANPTVLSGVIGGTTNQRSYHVVLSRSNNSTAVLNGFKVTGGIANASSLYINQNDGGGMININSSPTIANCVFSDNESSNDGGGMYNDNSSPTIMNCSFSNNNSNNGGGMFNNNSSPTITNCNFSGNYGRQVGGGMYNDNSSPTITNCSFSGNNGGFGGGMYNARSSFPIANCIFFNNRSTSVGGGIYNESSSPVNTNCTFTLNQSAQGGGGGMYNSNSFPTITNSISWNNSGYGRRDWKGIPDNPEIYDNVKNSSKVTFSIVKGGYTGNGNINADPQFINDRDIDGADNILGTADDGLRQQMTSPAINAGSNVKVPSGITTDITGAPRILESMVDMGSYESSSYLSFHKLYVDVSSPSLTDGLSWATPYHELRDALVIAAQYSSIDTILVAKGTYRPGSNTNRDSAFVISRGGLKIYGGYPSGGGVRNINTNATILSGDIGTRNDSTDNSYHVLVIAGIGSSADSIIVDGFTISGGNANANTTKVYNGVSISNNSGAGVCINASGNGQKTSLRNLIITQNSAANLGGGMYTRASSPLLVRCNFIQNQASNGGGMRNENTAAPLLSLVNCVFAFNTAPAGGGISNDNSALACGNCLFTGNNAITYGGAILNWNNSSNILTNCTFRSNTSSSGSSLFNYTSSCTITNSILWNNSGSSTQIGNISSSATVSYSIIQGGYSGTGNITTAPAFLNVLDPNGADNIFGTADDGLQLLQVSAGVESGINTAPYIPATDLSGRSRRQGVTVDMGAYEYQWGLAFNSAIASAQYKNVVPEEQTSRKAVTMYPVPAKDVLWLSGGTADLIGTTAIIMNMNGQVVQSVRISQSPQRIDVSMLGAGTYLIKLPAGKAVTFIKQ